MEEQSAVFDLEFIKSYAMSVFEHIRRSPSLSAVLGIVTVVIGCQLILWVFSPSQKTQSELNSQEIYTQPLTQLAAETQLAENVVAGLAPTFEFLSAQIADLQNKLDTLNTTTTSLTEFVQQAASSRRPLIISNTKEAASKYTIHAILPNSVYLKDANHNLALFNLGEEVTGFGKIVEINAADGVVSFDSGVRLSHS
jgi:predicted PurR-regulated permease PerM